MTSFVQANVSPRVPGRCYYFDLPLSHLQLFSALQERVRLCNTRELLFQRPHTAIICSSSSSGAPCIFKNVCNFFQKDFVRLGRVDHVLRVLHMHQKLRAWRFFLESRCQSDVIRMQVRQQYCLEIWDFEINLRKRHLSGFHMMLRRSSPRPQANYHLPSRNRYTKTLLKPSIGSGSAILCNPGTISSTCANYHSLRINFLDKVFSSSV